MNGLPSIHAVGDDATNYIGPQMMGPGATYGGPVATNGGPGTTYGGPSATNVEAEALNLRREVTLLGGSADARMMAPLGVDEGTPGALGADSARTSLILLDDRTVDRHAS
jgi:hypothetical protein